MSTIKKWIIDTNILVHWLIAQEILKHCINEFHLPQEFLNVYQNRFEKSIAFLNNVLETQKEKHLFFIVELSLSELFSGVRDEVRSILYFTHGIPISRWVSKRETQEVRFPENLSEQLYNLASRALDTLLDEQKIEIIPASSGEDNYLDVYSSLIFLHPDLKTQDAILLTTGIFEECNYFVTTDKALIKLNREIEPRYKMALINTHKALDILASKKVSTI